MITTFNNNYNYIKYTLSAFDSRSVSMIEMIELGCPQAKHFHAPHQQCLKKIV